MAYSDVSELLHAVVALEDLGHVLDLPQSCHLVFKQVFCVMLGILLLPHAWAPALFYA